MSSYIQGGAHTTAGEPIPTKKALRAALASEPGFVWLYATSPMGPQFRGAADELPEGVTFNVVGPDPYNKRNWYASVARVNGKVKVTV